MSIKYRETQQFEYSMIFPHPPHPQTLAYDHAAVQQQGAPFCLHYQPLPAINIKTTYFPQSPLSAKRQNGSTATQHTAYSNFGSASHLDLNNLKNQCNANQNKAVLKESYQEHFPRAYGHQKPMMNRKLSMPSLILSNLQKQFQILENGHKSHRIRPISCSIGSGSSTSSERYYDTKEDMVCQERDVQIRTITFEPEVSSPILPPQQEKTEDKVDSICPAATEPSNSRKLEPWMMMVFYVVVGLIWGGIKICE